MYKLIISILKDKRGTTLSITRKTANTLATASGMNTNYDEIEAVVNALTADNLAADSVTATKINSDVVRDDYGLVQHTDGSLYVDLSDTNPGLELEDGGLRVKADDSTIQRASGGIEVKQAGLDHGSIGGLTDDDHSQYLNTARFISNHDTSTRHPLTVGGTGATSASGAFTNIVTPKVYDSGWFAVSTNSTYTKTHSLGTTKVLAKVWFSDSSSGASNVFEQYYDMDYTNAGIQLQELTTTAITLRTQVWRVARKMASGGGQTDYTSGYCRIIIIALE